jgi:hypothetical protein
MKHGTENSENIEESKRAARGPQKRGARGICRFCHMVNPALVNPYEIVLITLLKYSVNYSLLKAFVSVMDNYTPLSEDVCVVTDHDEPIVVDEESIAKKLRQINISRAGGPDGIPNCMGFKNIL